MKKRMRAFPKPEHASAATARACYAGTMRTVLPRRFLLALTAPLIALVALACSDGGASVDETYLRDLCDANRALEGAVLGGIIGNALEGGDSPADDPADMLASFIDPLREWVEALRAATPPDDMAAFHTAALDAVEGLLALFADMDAEADGDDADDDEGLDALLGLFAGFGALSAIPDPPREALDRLSEAADEVSECNRGLLAGQLLDQFLSGFADGFAITDGDGGAEEAGATG